MNSFEAVIGAGFHNEIVWSLLILNKDNENEVNFLPYSAPAKVGLALPLQGSGLSLGPRLICTHPY